MPDLDTALPRDGALVRKPLKGSVALGGYPSAPVIDTLVAPAGQIIVPTSYPSVGWIGEDGLSFSADTEVSDVRGWGSSTFIRRDTKSEERTVKFSALETKRLTHELITGLDLSTTTVSAAGEWRYDVPDRVPTRYWRLLCIGMDGDGDERIYMGRLYPKAVVSERDDEAWSDGDDPRAYGVTMTALIDDTAGFVMREFMFGPGVLAKAAAMGLSIAA